MIVATYDANILAAGFLGRHTPPGAILDAWRAGHVVLVTSEHVLEELARTLDKPYFRARLAHGEIERFLQALREETVLTPLVARVEGVATHWEDDLVLATAVSGKAAYLVTGDQALRRRVPAYQGVRVVTAREFLGILAAHPDHSPPGRPADDPDRTGSPS